MICGSSPTPVSSLTEEQRAKCLEHGYLYPTMIGGELVALQRFVTTIGLVYGIVCDPYAPPSARRFCYTDVADAYQALLTWERNPTALYATGPWLKVKGFIGGQSLDFTAQDLFKRMHAIAAVTGQSLLFKLDSLGKELMSGSERDFPLYVPGAPPPGVPLHPLLYGDTKREAPNA